MNGTITGITLLRTKCTECGSIARLHTSGEFVGIWECTNPTCGASDVHDHDDVIREEIEVDTMRSGEYDTYNSYAYKCATCNMELDIEEGERLY